MSFATIRTVLLGLAVLVFAFPGSGQTHSRLAGRVMDANGDSVAGASLTISRRAVRFVSNVTADTDGTYLFGDLAPGIYDVTAVAAGFASERTQVKVPLGKSLVFILK